MTMTLAEYEAYLRTLSERIEHIEPPQQNTRPTGPSGRATKPAKKKRLIKKQFHHKKQR